MTKKLDVSEVSCICCGKKIKLLDSRFPDIEPWKQMWDNGVVDKISAGYGSNHDGSMWIIGICDECLSKKQKDNTLIYVGDYMSREAGDDNE